MSVLLEESEKKGVKLAKEVDKLNSKVQDLEVQKLLHTHHHRLCDDTSDLLLRSCGRRRRGRS